MKNGIGTLFGHARVPRRRLLAAAIVCAVPLVSLTAATPSLAKTKKLTAAEKEEFLPFADCPLESAEICLRAETTGGEFVIGSKTLPIGKPILLQGGLAESILEHAGPQPLIAAVGGETLAKVPEEDPGGLVGVDGLGGEVTATAELAGPVSSVIVSPGAVLVEVGTAVSLPLKVHLQNENLGENCYIGSDAEPIVLHLTVGKTSPPEGTEPIQGSRTPLEYGAQYKIIKVAKVTLVDNTFAVPAATGCGNELDSSVLTPILNADIGLPSAAGKNKAVMSGPLEQTDSSYARENLPKPKKQKKEKKEKKEKK
jgi:hypothetical protein